ncbi:hypothetical protein TELCIR_04529 [Teladorsagia circumcincta]|uniref:ENTH domain-containing protein n=1 Tax=Teladorsagia circumcincta TaxID=45464 RepID=A0A2G9UTD5_TELCI|nr:hypothetical protein TELCIR_04529 [Teladorsagia circumcincta]
MISAWFRNRRCQTHSAERDGHTNSLADQLMRFCICTARLTYGSFNLIHDEIHLYVSAMSDLLSGISSLTKQISNNIPYQIKKLGESVHTIVMNYTEAENLVYEATNEDPWGPTGPQMKEIANYTFQ